MHINDNSRVQITITATTSVDPAAAVAVLAIDTTEYPCTWLGAATNTGNTWTRTGHTNTWFAGAAVPTGQIDGATVLARGIHTAELRVTIGDTIMATELPWIRVA